MQTFMPLPDFLSSLTVLDYRRLGKQRVEAKQLIDTILERPTKSGKPRKGWRNHPAAIMWRGYVPALQHYHNLCIDEWITRGYKNSMPREEIADAIVMPHWMGDPAFHASHRSNLLRKDPKYYSGWGWTESDNLEYLWPGEFPGTPYRQLK